MRGRHRAAETPQCIEVAGTTQRCAQATPWSAVPTRRPPAHRPHVPSAFTGAQTGAHPVSLCCARGQERRKHPQTSTRDGIANGGSRESYFLSHHMGLTAPQGTLVGN